jgi:uncharacterized protein YggU (UPF0235/DUF167 family)
VRVTPRAGRDEVVGVSVEGVLLVKVRAAPADGAANAAALKVLATALDVAPSRLQLVRGASARTKTVSIEGVADSDLKARWPGLASAMR